jgi:hypothetical protein
MNQPFSDPKAKRKGESTMTGIFTRYNFFVDQTPDLEGQVAVVTVCLLSA